MSEVHRYDVVVMLSEAGNRISYNPHGPEVVLASNYDALAQQLAAEKVKTQTLMIELQDKNGALVDLREQLVASQAEVAKLNEAAAFMDNVSQGIEDGLRAQLAARDKRLEEAVGLLRDLESVDSSEPYCPVCFNFIGCGHDIGCKLKAFLTTLEQDKENE